MDKCAICGTAHASCGPRTTVVPIDERITLRKGDGMADLKNYRVKVATRGDRFVETTLLLSDEDAKRQGLTEKDLASKAAPANKAAKPEANQASAPSANKSRARAPRTKAKAEPKTTAASDTTPAADDTAQGEQTPAE